MGSDSSKPPNSPDVSLLLISMQPRLQGLVRSLVPNRTDAEEVVQEVNLYVLEHAEEFQPGTNFSAWAFKIARVCVLKWHGRQARSKLVFDEALLDRIGSAVQNVEVPANIRLESLEACLNLLTPADRSLVMQFYGQDGETPRSIAERQGRTPNSLYVSVHRIRAKLFDCIHRRTSADSTPDPRE